MKRRGILIGLILLFIVIIVVSFLTSHAEGFQSQKNIICILSVQPSTKVYTFLKDIKLNSQYDVYIVIDDNDYDIPGYDGIVDIIKVDNKECEKNGYKSSVLSFNNRACSRDKALYYFNKENIPYNYIWFIEEDVFIPSVKTLEDIDNKYPTGDLLVQSHNIINEKKTDWHWEYINSQIRLDLPYASSMICAIRCSKRMMSSINKYAVKNNNLFLDEALFNTLALHNNLDVKAIPELSNIVYRKDWNVYDIKPTNLYHPIKDIETQYKFREYLTMV
jgi:hypothetical protein